MKKKEAYMIGIKGVGMTMLAQFLAAKGWQVSGSDINDRFMTDRVLKRAGIKVKSPFAAANLPSRSSLIIHSSAFSGENNPEMAAVLSDSQRFPKSQVLSYAAALGQVFNRHRGIAVCGSHGKTTTSAWLGYVLSGAGKQPNVLTGARVPQFKGSTLIGSSRLFVAEVDEYQNKLQYFQPQGIVLNNIEFDHPDFFKDQAAYAKVFAAFLKKLPASGFAVLNNGDPEIRKIMKYCRGRYATYDIDRGGGVPTVNYLASNLRRRGDFQVFSVNDYGEFKIRLWGEHNVLNALAVIAAARFLGVKLPEIKKQLAAFRGTERRAQILGRYQGAVIIDDYAHHPTEIQATLAGLHSFYGSKKKLRVLFHPHTYTRTKALFSDFAASFEMADEVSVLDIYGSAREKQGGVSSAQLVRAINEHNRRAGKRQAVRHLPTLEQASRYFQKELRSGEVLLLMGAGDVFRVGEAILKK